MKNAQVSLEIMVSMGTVILILLLVFLVSSSRNMQLDQAKRSDEAREACYHLSTLVAEGFSVGEGFNTTTRIFQNVTVMAEDRVLFVHEPTEEFCSFPHNRVRNAQGNSSFGLTKGWIQMSYDASQKMLIMRQV